MTGPTTQQPPVPRPPPVSPQALIATDDERDPDCPLALGDATVLHDRLVLDGEHVGDELGSRVIAAPTPEIEASCRGAGRRGRRAAGRRSTSTPAQGGCHEASARATRVRRAATCLGAAPEAAQDG